jgi:hypothetical protein
MNPPANDSFVPLTTAAQPVRDRKDFRVIVLKDAKNIEAFHALGRPVAGVPGTPACEPKVTLQREGDRVSAIHIVCSCGQTIDLACDYPAV